VTEWLLPCAVVIVAVAFPRHAWRWLTGLPMAGRPGHPAYRTDATWNRPGANRLHPIPVIPWHWWRRRRRAGIRSGGTLAVLLLAEGLLTARTLTLAIATLAAVAAIALAVRPAVRKVTGWQHHRTYVRPLEGGIRRELGAAPQRLMIVPDRSRVVIDLDPDFTGSPGDRAAIERAVAAKVTSGLEADWDGLGGRKPQVVFRKGEPLPTLVTWDDVKDAVDGCGPDELVVGIGKRGEIVKVSLAQDAAHLGMAMGSGAGKSNLTAFWLLQELRRGAIALILDAKLFSHPWAFKDMDAEFGLLPNMRYARRTHELHDAMVWGGAELDRRNDVAMRAINAKGQMRPGATVGPRLFIVGEELNIATDRLKAHWAAIREKGDPKRSPALSALSDVSCGGRAADERLILVAQMLTAAAAGGGPVRENVGVKAMARYTANSWKMQTDLPMPPVPDVDGRVQVIASGAVHEVQVPLMDLEQVRELVLAGNVTPCPAGMPGSEHAAMPVPGRMQIENPGPGLGNVIGQGPDVPGPPGAWTLREAADAGLWPSLAAARKASTRPGFPDPVGVRDLANLYDLGELKVRTGR
jgi:hypothetical protein